MTSMDRSRQSAKEGAPKKSMQLRRRYAPQLMLGARPRQEAGG